MTTHAISTRAIRTTRVMCCVGAIALSGAVLAGCGSSSSTSTPTTPAQLFSAGFAAQTAGNPKLAATYYSEVLLKYPKEANAAYDLGVAEGSLGNVAAAEAAYQRALAINPMMTSALFNLADAQSGTNPEAAIVTLRRLLKILPKDADTQFNLGLLLARHGKLAEGQALLAKAIATDPSLHVPSDIKLPASAG
jgi:tetratricopeptide (TPR) repeat protein